MVSSPFWGLSLLMVFWEAGLENLCSILEYFSCTKSCCLSYQLVTPCDVGWTVSTAEQIWCWWRLCHDHRACLGSILNMLLDKRWASAQVWLQNVNGRTTMAYQVLGTFQKQGQSSFKAALKREVLFCTSLTPSLLCTDAAPLKMYLPNFLSEERQEICCPR